MRISTLFTIGALLLTITLNAHATRDDFYIYVGASQSIYQSSSTDLDFGVDETSDEDGFPYELHLGISFNRFLGLEVSYLDGAELNGDIYFSNSPLIVFERNHAAKGLTLAFVPKLSAGIVSFYGKLGLMRWDLDENIQTVKDSDSGISLVYGIGMSIELGEHFALTGELKETSMDATMFDQDEEYELQILSLGARFAF